MNKKTVMLIEDTEEVSLLVQRILNSQAYEVLPIFDSADAISRVKELPPHLILLDIMMPKINGFQILEEIKKIPYLKHIPVIMLTSLNTADKISTALKLGAFDYIVKPINATIILKKVKNIFLTLEKKPFKLEASAIHESYRNTYLEADARLVGLGEMEIKINSDYFFLKGYPITFNAGLFKEIQIEAPRMKVLRNIIVQGRRYKCINECHLTGLTDEDMQKIRAWVNTHYIGKGGYHG